MDSITRELAGFAVSTKYEDLPENIVRVVKFVLMEHIGCAVGALTTDKGKMMAALGRRYGGPPESSIIGTGNKVSCGNAALANGELMIALDYHDIVADGHDGVYVLPAVLAIAEMEGVSGKDLILSTAIGLEISARLARAVGRHTISPEDVRRKMNGKMGLTGNAYSNFGAAAGAARLMGMDEDATLHAMGIAGHLCMVLSYGRWGADGHTYMAKYGVPGWQSTGAVSAVLLAEMGYTGDTTVLDNPQRGFAFYVGYPNWYPEEITVNLGKDWCFDYRLLYKPYPCCGVFHSTLDCFRDIIEQHNITPEEIELVKVFGRGMMKGSVTGISGAQFNLPYNLSVAAHRVPIGIEWLDPGTMSNPEILTFMDKVEACMDKEYMDKYTGEIEKDPSSLPAKVSVIARGETFTGELLHRKGTAGIENSWTEKDASEKFRHNAERILTKKKIQKAIEILNNVENIDSVRELMDCVTM